MSSETLLARLRDAGEQDELAGLIVDDVLARPVAELVDAAEIAAALGDAARALAASDTAEGRIAGWARAAAAALAAEERPLGALLPAAVAAAARELAALPLTPRRETIEKVLDRAPVRRILRAQILTMLVDFARRAASPITDNPIARGLGGLSRLAFSQTSKGKLGTFASAISGEVERQAERRASEFADTAVAEVIDGMAGDLSDPARAREQAEARGAVLDGVLALSPAEIVEPLPAQLGAALAIARRALAAWSATPGFEAELAALLTASVAREAARPLGELLADLGLGAVARARGRAAVRRRLAALVESDAFARWLLRA